MKRITIIGDSYACGEWMAETSYGYHDGMLTRPLISKPKHSLMETHPGVELYLNEMGHACCTLGIGGSSNLTQLYMLEESLMLRTPRSTARYSPDYILWFITEPMRDVARTVKGHHFDKDSNDSVREIMNTSSSMKKLNERVLGCAFDRASRIFDMTGIPFILVQGLSGSCGLTDGRDFVLHSFDTWVEDMVGMPPPIVCSMQNLIDARPELTRLYGYEELEHEMEEYARWNEMTSKCEYMPDGGHPNRYKHKELAEEIHKILSQ